MKKTIRKANKKDELNWPVPDAWKSGNEIETWAPAFCDSYEGPCGGPDIYGPSNSMNEICRTSDSIASIFLNCFLSHCFII